MIVLVQRVKEASVIINNIISSSIKKGIVIFLGIEKNDVSKDITFIINKLLNLRIFNDKKNKMNLSLRNIKGSILVVSQFTLCANLNSGHRPSFIESKNKDEALILYNEFIKILKKKHTNVEQGKFGANMDIKLINEGPATFIINSNK